jgi:hypothetical protein
MTLDDIQTSILHGQKEIESALELVSDYITNKKHILTSDKVATLSQLLRLTTRQSMTIPASFVNNISINSRYKSYVKMVLENGKISDPRGTALKMIDIAQSDCNKRILDAKETETKRNREYEKTEVMRFLQINYNSMVSLLELFNLFQDMKTEINR